MLPSCRCGNWLTPDDPRRLLPLSTGGEGLEVIVGLTVSLDVIPLMMFSIQKTNIKEWKGNISEFNSFRLLIVFLHSNSLKSWALQCIMHVQILTSNGEQNSFRTSFCLTWTTNRFLIGKTDILKFSFSFPPQNPQVCFKCVSVTPTNQMEVIKPNTNKQNKLLVGQRFWVHVPLLAGFFSFLPPTDTSIWLMYISIFSHPTIIWTASVKRQPG